MRETFETAATLEAETRLKEQLEHLWNVTLHKLPRFYQIDFVATRPVAEESDDILGWVEVKCRTHSCTQYQTIILAVSKWLKLIELAKETLTPAMFAVAFTDATYYIDAGLYAQAVAEKGRRGVRYRWGGRTVNTRDEQDIEPVVHIPIKIMTRVE